MERTFLFFLCFLSTGWASKDISIHINTKRWINYVSDKYLSVTIDPGTLYSAGKLSEASLNMARGLSPAYVRLGGPMTNHILFGGEASSSNFSVSEDVWKDVNKFVKEAGLDLIVCLNGMQRGHGVWDSSNALELISFSDKYGYNLAWQLGYDIEGMGRITGTELGRDIVRLRKILDGFEHYIKSPVLGPDIPDVEGMQQINFIKELLNQAAPALTALTVNLPNSLVVGGDSVDYGVNSMMNSLDTYVWPKDPMRGLRNVPKKPIWMAEPEIAKPNFEDAMLWMEKLGSAAKKGCQVIMRQPSPVSFHTPTPDFWVSILFKNLVGQGVLDTRMNNGSMDVSIFSHCTATVSQENSILDRDIQYSKGSITIYGVNPSTEYMKLGVRVNMKEEVAHVYVLTSSDEKDSDETFLNGQKLSLSPTGELPIISPRIKPPSKHITVPPHSIFFAVLPEFKVRTCSQNPFSPADVHDLFRKGRLFFSGSNEEEMDESTERGSNVYVKFRQHQGVEERHTAPAFKEPLKALLRIPGKLLAHRQSVKSEPMVEKPESEYKYITYNENSWLNQLSDALQTGELNKSAPQKHKSIEPQSSEDLPSKPKPENFLKSLFLGPHLNKENDKARTKRATEPEKDKESGSAVGTLPGKTTYEITSRRLQYPGALLNQQTIENKQPTETTKKDDSNQSRDKSQEGKTEEKKEETKTESTNEKNEKSKNPTKGDTEMKLDGADTTVIISTTKKRHVYDWTPSSSTEVKPETSTNDEAVTTIDEAIPKVTSKRDIYGERYGTPSYYPYWAKRGADFYLGQMSQRGEHLMSTLDDIDSQEVLNIYNNKRAGCDENKTLSDSGPKLGSELEREPKTSQPSRREELTNEFLKELQNPPRTASEESKFRSILSELMKTINERSKTQHNFEIKGNEQTDHEEKPPLLSESSASAEGNEPIHKPNNHEFKSELLQKHIISHNNQATEKEEPCHKTTYEPSHTIQQTPEKTEVKDIKSEDSIMPSPITTEIKKEPLFMKPMHNPIYQRQDQEHTTIESPLTIPATPKESKPPLAQENFKTSEHRNPIVFVTRPKGHQGFESVPPHTPESVQESQMRSNNEFFASTFTPQPPKVITPPRPVPLNPNKTPHQEHSSGAPMPVLPNLRSQHESSSATQKPLEWKPKLFRPGIKPFVTSQEEKTNLMAQTPQTSHPANPPVVSSKIPEAKAAPEFKNIMPHIPPQEAPKHYLASQAPKEMSKPIQIQSPTLKKSDELTTPTAFPDKAENDKKSYLFRLGRGSQGIIFNDKIYPATIYGMMNTKQHKDYVENGHLIVSDSNQGTPTAINLKDIMMHKTSMKTFEEDQVSEASSHISIKQSPSIVILPEESVRKIMKDNPDLFSKSENQEHSRRRRSLTKSDFDNTIQTQIEEVREIENEIMADIKKINMGEKFVVEKEEKGSKDINKTNELHLGPNSGEEVKTTEEESKAPDTEHDDYEEWSDGEKNADKEHKEKEQDDSDWKAKQLFIPLLLSKIKNVLDVVQKLVTSN